jgi:hypothetical protein
VVGGRAGVAAGPEPVQHLKVGEGAEPVFGGVEMVEGELGELVAGEHPMLQQQPAQPPVAVGEPTSQRSHLEGNPIGSNPTSSTS